MSLTENIDYTLEDGNLVFTREYLLQRGQCCGSGCRNCPYPGKMKIISMVPSWTETLAACGANVVGRTRFCIHPKELSAKVVGGTKDWNLDAVKDLAADLTIFDQEENPKIFAETCPANWIATDIRRVQDVAPELRRLAEVLQTDAGVAARLRALAERWESVLSRGEALRASSVLSTVKTTLPGLIQWLRLPHAEMNEVAYVIWREPWMTVTRDTFIGSVLEQLGFKIWSPPAVKSDVKYPAFEIDSVPNETVLLFSSEPYPFARKAEELRQISRSAAIVDGECFSWFGLRTLRFLESVLLSGNL